MDYGLLIPFLAAGNGDCFAPWFALVLCQFLQSSLDCLQSFGVGTICLLPVFSKSFQAKRNITFPLAVVLAQVAITKGHRLGSFKNQMLVFGSCGGWDPGASVGGSGESSLPGRLLTVCSRDLTVWREVCLPSLRRALISS